MSGKETVIEWVRQLPDDLGIPEILSVLRDRAAASGSRPASGGEDYEWPAPDLTEDEWRQFIAYNLRRELEDPREDIYSQDDGVSRNEQG
jgi:hypothetical protein